MTTPFTYLDVCSGIGAASVAWGDQCGSGLGWRCAGYAEIEAFPRAVLDQRHGAVAVDWDHRAREDGAAGSNFTPLFGDFTKIEAHHVGSIDLLVGGTPCQSFSVAGKRLGLDDPRGNLTIEFFRLAQRLRARWVVWENVPGALSNWSGEPPNGESEGDEIDRWIESRDFADILTIFRECGYSGCYRVLDAQYVRVDGFGRAVPQRRRRLFLVGHLGGSSRPATVLFDRESLRGDFAPRREAGQAVAPCASDCTGSCCDGLTVAARMVAFGEYEADGTASTTKARDWKDATDLVASFQSRALASVDVSPTVRAGGNTTGGHRPYGTDVDTADSLIAVPTAFRTSPNCGAWETGDRVDALTTGTDPTSHIVAVPFAVGPSGNSFVEVSPTLDTRCKDGPIRNQFGVGVIQTFAFTCKDHGQDAAEGIAPTLRSMSAAPGRRNGGGQVAFAFTTEQTPKASIETAFTLTKQSPTGGGQHQCVATPSDQAWAVRRLTPRECERLQGFPDDFTAIRWRGKEAPDGPRYKAIGNSMAVNVMRWIGMRIDLVERATREAQS